jgi:cystathionine beta-lyase/cystathionine gamma-synthase
MAHKSAGRGFTTRAIRAATTPPHVAQRPDSVPIYQAVTFSARDSDELADIVTDQRPGYAYARIDNPTGTALADAIAELEGAEAAYVLASGMAAIHAALLSVVAAGDRIVSTRNVYGTTRSLLTAVLGKLGVTTAFVDATDLAAVEEALRAAPARVLYLETISNPTISVLDLGALIALAHRHGALAIVDNTFASPFLCRPAELGADLVVESATKYLAGHSDVLAGIVAGSRPRIAAVRKVQTDTGGTLAPLSAFLVLRGLPTLEIRMRRHAETAALLAAWLERQAGVSRVWYPGLASHPQGAIAARQFPLGGGMFAFELADGPGGDGRAAATAFIDALTVPVVTASLGSIHTIVVHPPRTTHRQLDDAALAASGIAPGLLRVSVGLEDGDDLQADFEAALHAARKAVAARGQGATAEPVGVGRPAGGQG